MPIKNLNIRGAILTRSCTGLNRSLIKQLLISHDIFELYTRVVIESVITIRKDSAPSPRSLFESYSSQFNFFCACRTDLQWFLTPLIANWF